MYKDNGYIYRVYKGKDTFHCERFPIIYSNDDYIYYKKNTSNSLERISKFFLSSKEKIEQGLKEANYIPKIFFSTDFFSREELDSYFKEEKIITKLREELELRRKYIETKRRLSSIAIKYEMLTNENIEAAIKSKKNEVLTNEDIVTDIKDNK